MLDKINKYIAYGITTALLIITMLASLYYLARNDIKNNFEPLANNLTYTGFQFQSSLYSDMYFCLTFGVFRDESGKAVPHIFWSLYPFRKMMFASG
jgi:hypothetical protein